MLDFERLGVFYLGRRQEPGSPEPGPEVVLYDSRDLVTHALTVGMTGSGKTGLGVALVEEAAIDGVPVIVIDPKGDLTNLLLTFPSLAAGEFEPWVSEEEAARAGMTRTAFAEKQAAKWKAGLAEWGQDGARIERLRAAAEFRIYTPGTTSGAPVSVLGSLAPPEAGDEETLRERVQVVASSLLALAGINATDPMKDREHILLSAILAHGWNAGTTLDLAALVHAVQKPPVTRVGVMDVDSFFPPKDRFELAMALNALLASPGFEAWTRGDPLDVPAFLRSPSGKARVSIFTLAHLDDAQRMFFVALLLNAVAGWMRSQTGTASLRAMLYMDEIFGYFPPVANPPSKEPLLTLLKQGRASGLGVVLATQNPVDLDYRGLSNIGTWWLGRLQTERDKARVLDGLESAGASGFDRADVDRLLSGLTSRVFLMRNVHDEAPTLFHSRWALSYLRGPLSRDEIKRLTADAPSATPPAAPPQPAAVAGETSRGREATRVSAEVAEPSGVPAAAAAASRPVLPPDIPQYFAAADSSGAPWKAFAYGAADVRFADRRLKVDVIRTATRVAAIEDGPVAVDWDAAMSTGIAPESLAHTPPEGALFLPLPPAGANAKSYAKWTTALKTWIASNETLELLKSPSTGDVSKPGESEPEFRGRLQHALREARDKALDALRKKYAPRQASLEGKLKRAKETLARETEQAAGQKMQTAISLGATVLGALLGRRAASLGTVGRATTTMRGAGRVMREARDVERARESIEALEEEQRKLEREFLDASHAIETGDSAAEALEPVVLKPLRGGVQVKLLALVWMPATGERP